MKELVVETNKNLQKYHSYGIFAQAKYYTEITGERDLRHAFSFIKEKEIPYVVLGRGSNVIVKNNYYNGMILINKMTSYSVDRCKLIAEGGVSMPMLARKLCRGNLSGFEALIGIPGTIGGGVYMNSGVKNYEISKYLKSVEVMDFSGNNTVYNKEQCQFSYRRSIFHEIGGFILRVEFNLSEDLNASFNLQRYLRKRLLTQPIEKRNSGCIFRNPSGEKSAGKLIEACGLKGLRVGGAEVSTKHANFINNIDNATYEDIAKLIRIIKDAVEREVGVKLEPEIKII